MTMALKRRVNFNLDKVRLCYCQPADLFGELSRLENGEYVDFGYFRLYIIDNGRKEGSSKPAVKAKADIVVNVEQSWEAVGTLTAHNSAKYDGLCFLEFTNKTLYSRLGEDKTEKVNGLNCLPYIVTPMGLRLHNVTELEIAADCSYNPTPTIRRMIKDYEHYDMIMNGRRIDDEKRNISGYCEIHGRSRIRVDRIPSLNFHQSKDDGLKMRIYDKTKEITEASGKDYIEDWNDYGKHSIYRVEVTVKNEDYKQWLDYARQLKPEWGDLDASVGLLCDEAYRASLWHYCAHRQLYFKPKGQRDKVIDLIDIISSGEA